MSRRGTPQGDPNLAGARAHVRVCACVSVRTSVWRSRRGRVDPGGPSARPTCSTSTGAARRSPCSHPSPSGRPASRHRSRTPGRAKGGAGGSGWRPWPLLEGGRRGVCDVLAPLEGPSGRRGPSPAVPPVPWPSSGGGLAGGQGPLATPASACGRRTRAGDEPQPPLARRGCGPPGRRR